MRTELTQLPFEALGPTIEHLRTKLDWKKHHTDSPEKFDGSPLGQVDTYLFRIQNPLHVNATSLGRYKATHMQVYESAAKRTDESFTISIWEVVDESMSILIYR